MHECDNHAMSQYIYYIDGQINVSNINRAQLDTTYYSVIHCHREHKRTVQPTCSGFSFILNLKTSFAFDELPEALCSFCFCLRCFAIALALSTGSPHNGCNTPLYFGTSLAIAKPSSACLPSSTLSSSGFRA